MMDGYALHTDACTYVLDDEGVCRFVTSRYGEPPDEAFAAVGAQFVACLDVRAPGGLVPDLRLGTHALFVRREDGRSMLLRTTPIRGVEERGGPMVAPDPPTIRVRAMPPRARHDPDETTLTLVKPLLLKPPASERGGPPPPRPSRRNEPLGKKRK